ncbi:hypothetical protein ASG01_00365 [Chryseobacterium sp. Leaf180]|jgi:hypothetical protein|uniref:hypothetical protein n=1 Tax=Chryseobacterium sp. Leaf180 TaxID=1736289 RepID=UPI0006F975C1|nr:hypothetical protein [Chryseobacterium sp. Leaf180]KQR94377.1 hypothetical protein ASG01_00365 [Chryseobacterium sp. Leaf180]
MSRIRIVKGKIYEKVGGDLKYYSEADITEIASETYAEQSGKEISHTGNPSKPTAGEIKAKCLVMFRPHDLYKDKPDFGFDWLRSGDSGQKGDNWFGEIMGLHYEEASCITPYKDTNAWSRNGKQNPDGYFKKDLAMYDKKLKSYKSFTISWKKINKKPYLYPIPTLTLLKGKSALFNLKIEIQEKPKKLTFEFKDKKAEDYLSLNIKEIGDVRKGKYDKYNYFKITCKKSFDQEQFLYVKADGEICGAIRIHPNSSAFLKNINVVFLNVSTDISGVIKTGRPVAGGKEFFINCCNQALLIPNIIEEKTPLDCTGNIFFNKFKSKFTGPSVLQNGKPGQKVTSSDGMKDYLEGKLKDQFGDKYKGYFVLYFIGEESKWNGFSNYGWTTCVQFATHNKATIAHETIHALHLPHTFASVDQDKAVRKYTYKAKNTNNLMDYSHLAGIERFCLFIWQWNVLNKRIKI